MSSRTGFRGVVKIAFAILSPLLLMAIAQPVMAQSQNISGTVVDASGGLVPDATIKIVDVAKGGTARQTNSDQVGPFPGH